MWAYIFSSEHTSNTPIPTPSPLSIFLFEIFRIGKGQVHINLPNLVSWIEKHNEKNSNNER